MLSNFRWFFIPRYQISTVLTPKLIHKPMEQTDTQNQLTYLWSINIQQSVKEWSNKRKDSLFNKFSSVKFSRLVMSWLFGTPWMAAPPGLSFYHQLVESTETHVQFSQWCHALISSSDRHFCSRILSDIQEGNVILKEWVNEGWGLMRKRVLSKYSGVNHTVIVKDIFPRCQSWCVIIFRFSGMEWKPWECTTCKIYATIIKAMCKNTLNEVKNDGNYR